MFLKQKVRNRKKKWQHRAKVEPFANCGVKCSQPSVFLLRALLYSRVAHSARESDWLFPIGTSREVIVCAWIALIGRQIRELTRKIVIGRSGIQLRSLLEENWPSFKLRYAQTFFLENVFTFGGAKRSGSDRECKYFPIGINAREPLWR